MIKLLEILSIIGNFIKTIELLARCLGILALSGQSCLSHLSASQWSVCRLLACASYQAFLPASASHFLQTKAATWMVAIFSE